MSELFDRFEKASNLLDELAFLANQHGEITLGQQQEINTTPRWQRMVLLAGATVIMLGLFSFIISPTLFQRWHANLWPVLLFGGVFLALLLYVLRNIWLEWDRDSKLKRDYAKRAIRQGQGHLSHDKKGYFFELDNGLQLRLPAGESNGLLPGAMYQIFYLEESGFCLSASEPRPTSPFQVQSALNDILCSANGFSAEDLLANQNDEVTFSQRKKPLASALTGAMIVLLFLLFLVPFLLQPFSRDLRLSSIAVALIVILVGIFPFIGSTMLLNGLIETAFPKLQQVQGKAHKTIRVSKGKNRTIHYYYVINEHKFEISKTAYTALIDELEYRIYYLPRTKKLISIEHIPSRPAPSIF